MYSIYIYIFIYIYIYIFIYIKKTYIQAKIATSDQLCFNVVDQNNETNEAKSNVGFSTFTTLMQRQYPTLKQHRNVTQGPNDVGQS